MRIKIEIDGETIPLEATDLPDAVDEIFGVKSEPEPSSGLTHSEQALVAVVGALEKRIEALEELLLQKLEEETPEEETISEVVFAVPPEVSAVPEEKEGPKAFPIRKVYLVGHVARDKATLETAFRVLGYHPPRVIAIQAQNDARIASLKGQRVVSTRFVRHLATTALTANGNALYYLPHGQSATEAVKKMLADIREEAAL